LPRSADGAVPAGTRSIRVTLQFALSSNSGGVVYADNIALTLNSAASAVALNSITNAASGTSGAVAPGGMVVLAVSGVNLNSTVQMQLDGNGLVSTSLGNVVVYFDGWKAPLLYVNSSQIEAVAPFELDGKSSTVVHVEYQGVKSNNVTVNVVPAAPGIFTQPPAANTDGLILDNQWALVSKANPAAKGSTITVVFTGAGQTTPGGMDGHIESLAQELAKAPVTATIDGQTATVVYAGTLPFCWDGAMMAQIQVPSAAGTSKAVPVVLTVGGVARNAVTMWVK
jgi:uncharacterized protein (TIGR03437 family)